MQMKNQEILNKINSFIDSHAENKSVPTKPDSPYNEAFLLLIDARKAIISLMDVLERELDPLNAYMDYQR